MKSIPIFYQIYHQLRLEITSQLAKIISKFYKSNMLIKYFRHN